MSNQKAGKKVIAIIHSFKKKRTFKFDKFIINNRLHNLSLFFFLLLLLIFFLHFSRLTGLYLVYREKRVR